MPKSRRQFKSEAVVTVFAEKPSASGPLRKTLLNFACRGPKGGLHPIEHGTFGTLKHHSFLIDGSGIYADITFEVTALDLEKLEQAGWKRP